MHICKYIYLCILVCIHKERGTERAKEKSIRAYQIADSMAACV